MAGRNPDLDEMPQAPVVPASTSNQGGTAPQPTSVAGLPVPPPQNVLATGNSTAVTVLNPFGPRNEMLQGGIIMDLPGVCYSQYIQMTNQLEVSDDTLPWTIIAQLPYDPTSEFMNDFCRAYALQHERYNGDIMYQIQVIGNASYSGSLIAGWVPKRIEPNVLKPTDIQTLSFKAMSVTLPSVETFILHDARKNGYYREHNEGNIKDRPHIVIAVHTSIVSPLRTGITVRIRISSRFASVLDQKLYGAQPFMLAYPKSIELGPSPSASVFDNRPMGEVFPHMYLDGADYRMVVDGAATDAYGGAYHDMGRPIRTFQLPYPTIAATKNLQSPAVLCKDNLICFYYADYVVSGFDELVPGTDITGSSFNSIQDTFKESGYFVVGRMSLVELEWAKGKIIMQYDTTTRKGRVTVWVYQGAENQTTIDLPRDKSGGYSLPYSAVLGPVVTSASDIKGLPLTWRNVTISAERVSIVSQSEAAPSTLNDAIIERVVVEQASLLGQDSYLQFDLQDPESRQRVATLRWSTERRAFVISTLDLGRYFLYPSDIRKLVVANWSGVPKSSGFPNTTITQWASRSPALGGMKQLRVPNAALVGELGEAMAGEASAESAAMNAMSSTTPYVSRLFTPVEEDMNTLISDFRMTPLLDN
ncbi:MAG: calicivirus capsid-like protein [Novo Mesto picornavirus 1]|nr:MAG: calicivirus capsid-like protein [Novo Mesto picornavirus 1]